MEITAFDNNISNQNIYLKQDQTNEQDQINSSDDKLLKQNNIEAIYVDPEILSELNLKLAHTPDIINQKNSGIVPQGQGQTKENMLFKNIDFSKESTNFDKRRIKAVSGNLLFSQANTTLNRITKLL